MKKLLVIVICLMHISTVTAGPQWTWDSGVQTNDGAITVKSLTGSNTYSATQNPTGAVVKMNQNAVTQPPTVVVQATATLPIKAAGDPCTQVTSGTAPNQTADEGTAITADRTMLLSCQSGVWKQASGSGGGSGLSNMILSSMAGLSKTWSFTTPSCGYMSAMVDANKQPWMRIVVTNCNGWCDSGWVAGYSASCTHGTWYSSSATMTLGVPITITGAGAPATMTTTWMN